MKKVLIGLIVVLIDIKIPINILGVDIFADFIGYFLIYKGLEGLTKFSVYFGSARFMAMHLIWITFFDTLFPLLAIIHILAISEILAAMKLALGLAVLSSVILGIADMEKSFEVEMYSKKMLSMCKYYAYMHVAVNLVSYLLVQKPMGFYYVHSPNFLETILIVTFCLSLSLYAIILFYLGETVKEIDKIENRRTI